MVRCGRGMAALVATAATCALVDTTDSPYRRVVNVRWADGYHCSGFLYDDNTVATAGHCVWDKTRGRWRNYAGPAFVVPAQHDDRAPFGVCTTASGGLFTSTRYVRYGEADFDYGAIRINCRVGTTTGTFRWYNQPTGTHVDDVPERLVGYPGDKGGSQAGNQQWLSSGTVAYDTTYRVFYRNDTYTGTSGAPVYGYPSVGGCSICVIAVHSTAGSSYNSGPIIYSARVALYEGWADG